MLAREYLESLFLSLEKETLPLPLDLLDAALPVSIDNGTTYSNKAITSKTDDYPPTPISFPLIHPAKHRLLNGNPLGITYTSILQSGLAKQKNGPFSHLSRDPKKGSQ